METAEGAPAPADDAQQAAASAAAKEAAAAAPVGFAKRKSRGNIRKRAADEEGQAAADGDGGGSVVRKAAKQKESSMAFTTKRTNRAELFAFESNNAVQQARDSGATATNEQETAHDRDARWVVTAPILQRCLS
jgi:hypothetical protein